MADRKRKQTTSEGKAKKEKKAGKSGKKKKKTEITEETDPDLDLGRLVKPIGEYVRDREEMVNQMFWSLRGQKLKAMLPDLLKETGEEELKTLCLEHLEIMSKKRIRRILAGDNPDIISSSGTDDESSEDEKTKQKPTAMEADTSQNQQADSTSHVDPLAQLTQESLVGSTQADQAHLHGVVSRSDANHSNAESFEDGELNEDEAGGMRTGDNSELPEDNMAGDNLQKQDIEAGIAYCGEGDVNDVDDAGDGNASDTYDTVKDGDDGDEADDELENDDQIEEELQKLVASRPTTSKAGLSQNQMEILELEMRARAIKAMLQAQEAKEKKLK